MMQASTTLISNYLIGVAALVTASQSLLARAADNDPESWFAEQPLETVPQLGKGELEFLVAPPQREVLHSHNRISISAASLADGWVDIGQCYSSLDAIDRTEILYRYRNMRDLRIDSYRNIGSARVEGNSVQLQDLGDNASLCIRTRAQILYTPPDDKRVLRNGPFHRKFLDGYFPMRVTLEVTYPEHLLRVTGTEPRQQPGFEVVSHAGQVRIETLFAGSLTVEIIFSPLEAP